MSKLGVYVVTQPTGLGDFVTQTAAAGSPVPLLMSLDQSIPKVQTRIFRTQKFGADNGNMYAGDPIAAGRARFDECWPVLQQNEWDYAALINEPGRNDAAGLIWLCNFYIGAMQRADEVGVKLCIGEWSTGMPPLDTASIAIYTPMLRYAMAHGHVLGLHEYSLEGPMIGSPLCLRYRTFHDALPLDARPLFAITEAGPGAGYATGYTGKAYVDVVAAYDAEVMKDDYVLGVALFKLGGNESNMTPVMPLLTQYVASHPTPEPEPIMSKGGLHLSAQGNRPDDPYLPAEIQAMKTAKIDRAKFMSNGDPTFVHVLQANGIDLPNSVCRLFAAGDNTVLGDPARFYLEQRPYITEVYGHGVRLFEIHNEPNLISEGFGIFWSSPSAFADQFYAPVAKLIRDNFPLAQIVYPGLAPRPDWAAWKPSITALISQGLVQYVGVHCYWDSAINARSSEQGRTFERFADMGRPLLITEASWNRPTGTDAQKGASYAEYIASLPSYVHGVYFFVSHGAEFDVNTETWVRGNPSMLTAIPAAVGAGAVVPPPPVQVREFDHWQDEDTGVNLGASNPLTIVVTTDRRIRAVTRPKVEVKSVEVITDFGIVTGGGPYVAGASATLRWLPT